MGIASVISLGTLQRSQESVLYLNAACQWLIIELEVRDKRHVGLASCNMEKQALQNALQHLQASLNIVEVVTDALFVSRKTVYFLRRTALLSLCRPAATYYALHT